MDVSFRPATPCALDRAEATLARCVIGMTDTDRYQGGMTHGVVHLFGAGAAEISWGYVPLPATNVTGTWSPVADARVPRFRRGALAVLADPPEISRHGIPLALSPTEVALLALLVRRGRASHAAIAAVFEDVGASPGSLDVLTHRIRRKFAAIGAANPIETRRNWGLALRVEADMHGSTALWIGTALPPSAGIDVWPRHGG